MAKKVELPSRTLSILRKLFDEGKSASVRRVEKTQTALATELGLLKTGRGFIDLTERTMRMLGEAPTQAFVFVRVEPKMRSKAYEQIMGLDVLQAFRVTGDVDLIVVVERRRLDRVLKSLSGISGVKETSAHLVLAPLAEE